MSDFVHPGARNPKTVRFTLALTDEINTRLEALADAAGQNKTAMAAVVLAAGISVLEPVFQLRLQHIINAGATEKVEELKRDIEDLMS